MGGAAPVVTEPARPVDATRGAEVPATTGATSRGGVSITGDVSRAGDVAGADDSREPAGDTVTVEGPVTTPVTSPSGRASAGKERARRAKSKRSSPARTESKRASGPLFEPAKRPGRRVIRIVRHVQLWSVFKVALLGGLVLYAIFLIATGVAWSLANSTGQIHHIEQFMRQIGFDNWSFDGPRLFRAAALAGAVLLTAGSVMITLAAAIVNLIAEATGGIRITVIETDETDDDEDIDDH